MIMALSLSGCNRSYRKFLRLKPGNLVMIRFIHIKIKKITRKTKDVKAFIKHTAGPAFDSYGNGYDRLSNIFYLDTPYLWG